MARITMWEQIDKNGPIPSARPDLGRCWIWLGSSGRYARFGRINVHRFIYEQQNGPIDRSLTLDHLCRIKICVNPSHLEPVPNRENVIRGVGITAINANMTVCRRGHPFTGKNFTVRQRSDGSGYFRECRICRRLVKRIWRATHEETRY